MIDLFRQIELVPNEVQAIIDKYSLMDNNYENCENLLNELKDIGWTCEFGLDATPNGLRKLTKFDEWGDDKITKVFDCLLDEMSNDEAEELRSEILTREDKILYFIIQEEIFKNSFK